MKSKIARKGLILSAVPLIFELIFLAIIAFVFHQAEAVYTRSENSKRIIAETLLIIDNLWDDIQEITLSAALHRPVVYSKVEYKFQKKTEELLSLAAGDTAQLANMALLEKLLTKIANDLKIGGTALEEQVPYASILYPKLFSRNYQELRKVAMKIVNLELKKQASMPISSERIRLLLGITIVAGVIINVAIAVALWNFFGREITDRLATIIANIQKMKDGKPLSETLSGDDEIAALDNEFHIMADFIAESRKDEQALVGNVRSVICSLNRNLVFVKTNDEAARLWGKDYCGMSLEHLCSNESWSDVSLHFQRCINSTQISSEIDIRMIGESGRAIWMHWSTIWSNEHELFFCVAHDITQQKELQDLKSDFARMISHDLRSPLQSIQAFFEVLECGLYGNLNERGEVKVGILNRTVNHLIRLINNLLDLEKMDAGLLGLNLERSNLNKVVVTSFEYISELAQNRNLDVKIEIDRDLTIPLDQDKMIQVFQNLLGNAVKYSPRGGNILVSSRHRGNYVEVEIKDSGRGIPMHEQVKIFERFHQVKDESGKNMAGTGLGLAFCKQIVDLHGGQIGVESKEGAGSTFWLILPAAEDVSKITSQHKQAINPTDSTSSGNDH